MTTSELIKSIKDGKIKKNLINGEANDKELAWGTFFANEFYKISQFFVSYLWLGGSYSYNTEDKRIIADKLREIAQILSKYE